MRHRVSTTLVLVAAGVTAYYFGGLFTDRVVAPSASAEARPTVGGLFVEPSGLALGEVQETASHLVQFDVRNTTARPKTITEFKGSCGCASIEPREMTLRPGETKTVSVVIDLTQRASDGGVRYRIVQPVTKPGDHQVAVSFAVRGPNDQKEMVRVELRYHGRAK